MATKRPDSIEEFQHKRGGRPLPPPTHNQPRDLPLLSEQRNVYVANAREGIATLRKTFETWLAVGRGLKALHDLADEIGGKRTYDRLREREGLGKDVINKTRSSRLIAIIDNLAAVEQWRAGLTDKQRFDWASPEAVHRHCPVFATDKKPGNRPKPAVRREDNAELERELRAAKEEVDRLKGELKEAARKPATKVAGLWQQKPEAIAAAIVANLPGERVFLVIELVLAQLKGRKDASYPFLSKNDNVLLARINAKLAANGDPRRLTALSVPLLGVTFALKGGPDGTEGGMTRPDVAALGRDLGVAI